MTLCLRAPACLRQRDQFHLRAGLASAHSLRRRVKRHRISIMRDFDCLMRFLIYRRSYTWKGIGDVFSLAAMRIVMAISEVRDGHHQRSPYGAGDPAGLLANVQVALFCRTTGERRGKGRRVLSIGSIARCCLLFRDGYDNSISRMTGKVLCRFLHPLSF